MLDLNETTVKEKAMDYELVIEEGDYYSFHSTCRELQKRVNEKIADGWELQGGVAIGYAGDRKISICQAMIKRNEKITKENKLDAEMIQVRRID